MKFFLQISFLFFLFGCSTNDQKPIKQEVPIVKSRSDTDTLYTLLNRSSALDTFEFSTLSPSTGIMYIKTGKLLSNKTKNAVLIYGKDSANQYTIELYSLYNGKWEKKDAIDSLYIFPLEFYVKYEDYNFDNVKDILVQRAASNGYTMSHCHLFTVDTINNKIKEHPEFAELANAKVDKKNKKIISDSLTEQYFIDHLTVLTIESVWKKDSLRKTRKYFRKINDNSPLEAI